VNGSRFALAQASKHNEMKDEVLCLLACLFFLVQPWAPDKLLACLSFLVRRQPPFPEQASNLAKRRPKDQVACLSVLSNMFPAGRQADPPWAGHKKRATFVALPTIGEVLNVGHDFSPVDC
jgi:hypothetical protein